MSLNELNIRSKVYKPRKPLQNANQQSFRLNYLSEFLSQQIIQNESMNDSIDKVITTVSQTQHIQDNMIDQMLEENKRQKEKSDLYLEKVERQGKTAEEIFHTLQDLQEKNKQVGENILNEQLMNQAILDQLSFQDTQLRNTNSQLENYVTLAKELSTQLLLQEQILKGMDEKLQIHDVYHSTVMERLDKQEALNEKILRQLNYLKTVVFERANSIIEKVDTSFMSTTDYISGLVSKSGFMKPFILSSRAKEKKENETQK